MHHCAGYLVADHTNGSVPFRFQLKYHESKNNETSTELRTLTEQMKSVFFVSSPFYRFVGTRVTALNAPTALGTSVEQGISAQVCPV